MCSDAVDLSCLAINYFDSKHVLMAPDLCAPKQAILVQMIRV